MAPEGAFLVELNGGGWAYKHEHQAPCISRTYKASWARKPLNLALLAKLRWKDGLGLKEIARRMGVCDSSVDRGLRKLRSSGEAAGKLRLLA